MLHFRAFNDASRSVGRSNLADSCPVFTPSKDVNDGRVAFSPVLPFEFFYTTHWNVVAVLSDEIADGVRDNCVDWKEGPNIPGRSRFKMLYR
jgi:hypothetical protein